MRATVLDAAVQCERDRAVEHLIETAARRGYRVAWDLVGDEAQDAVQEALACACSSWKRLRDPAALERWFFRVLVNHCRRLLRRRYLRAAFARMVHAEPVTPDPPVDAARLLHEIDRLPPMQRTAIVLRYRQELGIADIAELMGVGEATVKTHLLRALEKLRGRMGGA